MEIDNGLDFDGTDGEEDPPSGDGEEDFYYDSHKGFFLRQYSYMSGASNYNPLSYGDYTPPDSGVSDESPEDDLWSEEGGQGESSDRDEEEEDPNLAMIQSIEEKNPDFQ